MCSHKWFCSAFSTQIMNTVRAANMEKKKQASVYNQLRHSSLNCTQVLSYV